MVGKTSDEVLKLIRDNNNIFKQLSFSRLLSHWKRRIATTLQGENALFILNSSARVLSATNRFDPISRRSSQSGEHSLLVKCVINTIFIYVSYN